MGKNISVYYLHGIPKDTFEELGSLGYDINIPNEEKNLSVFASGLKPEDYIQIFSIYFGLEVTKELAKGTAEKLINNFSKAIKKIWEKLKDTKPALLVSGQEPEYKPSKATIAFEISDEQEKSTFEITNEIDQQELEKMLDTYVELVKLQYDHRLKEIELKEKYNLKLKKRKTSLEPVKIMKSIYFMNRILNT